jgi:GNAT superfamily N-acetyltransferase
VVAVLAPVTTRTPTLRIYRPWQDGVPTQLFADAGFEPPSDLDSDWVRVGRIGKGTVAAYALARLDATAFTVRCLVVARHYRGRGLGRWMLGHAIGISEGKGARTLDVVPAPVTSLFLHAGFVPCGTGLRLTLEPD